MDMDVSNENNNAKYYAHNQQHSCDDWMRFALTPLPSLDNANRDRPGRLDKIVKTMLDCAKFKWISGRYMLQLVGPLYTRLGFTPRQGDQHLDIKLRRRRVNTNDNCHLS